MIKFEFKKPRASSGDLRTPVTFFKFVPSSGPEPGEEEEKVLYECLAKIDNVWMKDIELAKSTGTLSDVTITIRNPYQDYSPTNKHYLSIDHPEYEGKQYNIKHVSPDLQNTGFITIVAGLGS